ncbi:MAG TPA: type II toxin-antitoxin system HicB family antitoxin [Mucilaginibacter sp.]|nr:type II toxin-antitoxin system HicB family antitoxin [Mucilaginibacter sp.]
MDYLIVFEHASDGTIWAGVPDLPGCYSCGETLDEAKIQIKEAIEFHIEVLKEEGFNIPNPQTFKAELIHI